MRAVHSAMSMDQKKGLEMEETRVAQSVMKLAQQIKEKMEIK